MVSSSSYLLVLVAAGLPGVKALAVPRLSKRVKRVRMGAIVTSLVFKCECCKVQVPGTVCDRDRVGEELEPNLFGFFSGQSSREKGLRLRHRRNGAIIQTDGKALCCSRSGHPLDVVEITVDTINKVPSGRSFYENHMLLPIFHALAL